MANKSPYPGYDLRAKKNISFDGTTKDYFFSRDRDVEALKYRLRKNGVVVLISQPEMGKTSLLKAGLLPSLKKGFTANFRNHWLTPYVHIVSSDPFRDLARQLASPNLLYNRRMKPEFEDLLYADLKSSIYNLSYICEEAENLEENNLLVIVDDFDSLFSEGKETGLEKDFLESLVEAGEAGNIPFSMIITLELDGAAFRFVQRHFPELISNHSYFLHRLSEVGLMEAILGPAEKNGFEIQERLWKELVQDLYMDDLQLSKLQQFMALTWLEWKNNSKDNLITKSHFMNRVGKRLMSNIEVKKKIKKTEPKKEPIVKVTKSVSLEIVADEIFKTFSMKDKKACSQIFQTICRYEISNTEIVSNPVKIGDVASILNLSRSDVINIVDELGMEIIVFDQDTGLLSIASSDLMVKWAKIKLWAIDEQDNARDYMDLCQAASKHFDDGMDIYDVWELQKFEDCKAWFLKNDKPSKEWGQQYSQNYSLAMDFLEKGLAMKYSQNAARMNPPPTSRKPTVKRKKITIKRK